jgi:hypothetical protein
VPRGYANINQNGPTIVAGSSKGVISVVRTGQNVYCFDLAFDPKLAVASSYLSNNATVGTEVGSAVHFDCGYGYEAAARTYGVNDSSVHSDVSFGIVFM